MNENCGKNDKIYFEKETETSIAFMEGNENSCDCLIRYDSE